MSLEVNSLLAEIFGLAGQRVREFTLRAAAGELPQMTVTHLLVDRGQVHATTRQFTLVPAESKDPEERAMQRVQAGIDAAAAAASQRLREDHHRAQQRLVGRKALESFERIAAQRARRNG
jgi:hypothetical protein